MGEEKTSELKEWLHAAAEAALILILLFIFLWPAKVEGVSMSPSVNDGDRVLICRFAAFMGLYGRGDLVVFDDDSYDENMIKRIIAVEGDTLHIDNGMVYVNGELLDEEYANGFTDGDIYMSIPSGTVFVMGDNREKSIDSRVFGTVNKKDIYGRVIGRFYPLNEIEVFK